jgi:hypothetical protein
MNLHKKFHLDIQGLILCQVHHKQFSKVLQISFTPIVSPQRKCINKSYSLNTFNKLLLSLKQTLVITKKNTLFFFFLSFPCCLCLFKRCVGENIIIKKFTKMWWRNKSYTNLLIFSTTWIVHTLPINRYDSILIESHFLYMNYIK